MKKCLIVTAVMLAMVGCGGGSNPAAVVEECWKHLSKGDVQRAVTLMDVTPTERAFYEIAYGEQCGELQAAGGVKEFETTGISEGTEDASVDAIVRLKDGQEIVATYTLIKREGKWLITE
ncbi:MAG: DUF4878 domain-containing protein [Tidjanibacter sp.]|nr:DUF4878 domain-containing protein [Tidjanibacter sp.]